MRKLRVSVCVCVCLVVWFSCWEHAHNAWRPHVDIIRQKDAACAVWPWRDNRNPRNHHRAHPAAADDNDDGYDCCDDASLAPCAPWPAPVWATAPSLSPCSCAHAYDASLAHGCVSCELSIVNVNGNVNANVSVIVNINRIQLELGLCAWLWGGGFWGSLLFVELSLKAWPLHLLKLVVWWMAACQGKHHASDKQQT